MADCEWSRGSHAMKPGEKNQLEGPKQRAKTRNAGGVSVDAAEFKATRRGLGLGRFAFAVNRAVFHLMVNTILGYHAVVDTILRTAALDNPIGVGEPLLLGIAAIVELPGNSNGAQFLCEPRPSLDIKLRRKAIGSCSESRDSPAARSRSHSAAEFKYQISIGSESCWMSRRQGCT